MINIKNHIIRLVASAIVFGSLVFLPASVFAVGGLVSPTSPNINPTPSTSQEGSTTDSSDPCADWPGGLAIPNCGGTEEFTCSGEGCLAKNPIMVWISFFINVAAALVGVGAVIMVIVAGLQYSASRDNPQVIQSAKQKLVNVLIGVAAFIFLWAFLQWIVPGGVFG